MNKHDWDHFLIRNYRLCVKIISPIGRSKNLKKDHCKIIFYIVIDLKSTCKIIRHKIFLTTIQFLMSVFHPIWFSLLVKMYSNRKPLKDFH